MNLTAVYRFLARTRVLALFDWFVTKAERVLRDYRYDRYQSRYDLHESFLKRRNEGITLYGDGEIRTGTGSYIGRNSRIKTAAGTRVSIGRGCALSHGVAIYTESWIPDQSFGDRNPRDFTGLAEQSGDVVIGDYAWIGYNVFVTPGTRIGSNAVVGANAVVTRDIPPDSIAVGAPARVVRFKSHVATERKQELAHRYKNVLREESKHVVG